MSLYLKRELVIGQESRALERRRDLGERFFSCVTLLRYSTRVVCSPGQREARSAAEEPRLYSVILKQY